MLSTISNRLLSGWRLTTAGCDACGSPLLQPPAAQGGPPACVACAERRAEQRANGEATPSPPTPCREPVRDIKIEVADPMTTDTDGAANGTPPPPRTAVAALAALQAPTLPPADRPTQVQDASGAMGDLLLRGWAMLGDCCPACATTPLMRSRDGRRYCVACRLFVVDEGEEGVGGGGQRGAGVRGPAPPEPAPAAATPPLPPSAARAAPPAPVPAAIPPPPRAAAPTSSAKADALAEAEAVLVSALREATAALEAARAASNPGGAAALACLVGDCARALKAVGEA